MLEFSLTISRILGALFGAWFVLNGVIATVRVRDAAMRQARQALGVAGLGLLVGRTDSLLGLDASGATVWLDLLSVALIAAGALWLLRVYRKFPAARSEGFF